MNDENNLKEITLYHKKANAIVNKLPSGKYKISIVKLDPNYFVRWDTCETSYPFDLIEQIFKAKGPGWLCDEIARDESPEYTGAALKWKLLSYVSEMQFKDKRLLDFGCGSGASSVHLSQMFPDSKIVGVELEEELLAIAKGRAKFYGLKNIDFFHSPNPENMPAELGKFDYICMTGVFEHLLPKERINLLPQLWSILNPGGILFLHETPYRYFPIETHTTGGLPFINYMPKKLALLYARTLSKMNLETDTWDTLLRKGIRGGTTHEILNILNGSTLKPVLLSPSRLGVKNRIDLWHMSTDKSRHRTAKDVLRSILNILRTLTRIELVPYLELAIQKEESSD